MNKDLKKLAEQFLHSQRRYPEVDADAIDPNLYFAHVYAMTAESLHSKSAIAVQLAIRDEMIVKLLSEVERLTARLRELASADPLVILHTGCFFGGEQDEWELEPLSQSELDQLCSGLHDQKIALIRRPEIT